MENCNGFEENIHKLLNTSTIKKCEISELNEILDKLNAVDLNLFLAEFKNIKEAVLNCCHTVSPESSLLVAKISNFIFKVISNRVVQFENNDLSIIVKWICSSLEQSADIAYADLLQLIDVLIKENLNFNKFSRIIFPVLLKKLECNAAVANPNDIKLLRINCLQSLAEILPSECYLSLAKEYIDLLYTQSSEDLRRHAQVWMTVIEALDSLSTKNSTWLESLLNDIIGIVLYGIELGLNGNLPTNPKCVLPTTVVIPPPKNNMEVQKVNLKVKKKKNCKIKQVGWSEKQIINVNLEEDNVNKVECFNVSWPTSDSDVSDTEGNQLLVLSKTQARSRHSAFNFLIQIIKVLGCKLLYEYYSIILGRLIICVKNEKLSKPKVAAMASINALLTGAKPFLAQAQHSEGGAFTTFSEVLSELVTALHATLGGILNTFPHMSIAIPLLHTTSALISVTPYHRLRPGLLSNLFKAICLYIQHKDPTISVGVLHCLSEIVILNPSTNEQKDIISSGLNEEKNKKDWLLSYCFLILKEQTSSDVRVACWQVVGGLCQCHFDIITPYFSTLENYIFQDLNAPNKPMIYAAKTLEHLLSKLLLEEEYDIYRKQLWMKLFEGPFISLIENSGRAAAIACDCLSNIGPQVFHSLKDETQIHIITMLYGCSYSDVLVVRGSAINTLGVFLLFPQLTHEQFVHDTKDILIRSLKDESDYVRKKSAWAFGNLVDLLIENQDKDFIQEISVSKLLEAALFVINDNSRVKANILRAVGNLVLLIDEEQLNDASIKDLVEKAVNFCLTCSNTGTLMKMRWNACYAIGTLLQNDALYSYTNKWLGAVINSLCNLLVKCNNFKVRANASAALSSIKKREYYNLNYLHVWASLLDGLDNAANMPDFKEFKHQDHLIQQLCCTICHLASILEVGDINDLNDILHYRMEIIKQRMLQFQNSAPPEKTGTLLNALNNINQLLKFEIDSKQQQFLTVFKNIFKIT